MEITNIFDQEWQFPCCFGVVDDAIYISNAPKVVAKGPKDTTTSKTKENLNHSVVLMVIVDAWYRFT